jgi:hypothetical protein
MTVLLRLNNVYMITSLYILKLLRIKRKTWLFDIYPYKIKARGIIGWKMTMVKK